MIPSNPYGIELLYNASTCAQMCQDTIAPDIATYQKLIIILATLVIGLALLLLLKGGKNK